MIYYYLTGNKLIDWRSTGRKIKGKREELNLTQDILSSKVGIRLATLARIETGHSRSSFSMLEKLAAFFHCKVIELIQEKEDSQMPTTLLERNEPALRGAPSFFRSLLQEASQRASLGSGIVADYSIPGYELGRHIDEYLSKEAWAQLEAIWNPREMKTLEADTLEFFKREFPGCLSLVPHRRIKTFMRGVMDALEKKHWL